MKKGFVFGKFLPFHVGHKALIDFGLENCDKLYVVICASNLEHISGEDRAEWIKHTYTTESKIEVMLYNYDEDRLPNTSESSDEVSKAWSGEFMKILPKVDVLFTSEPYGYYVASYMKIQHMSYDRHRTLHPISASQIRQSPKEYWHFLPPSVRPYFCKKIVLLGTESTGKTMLSEALAVKFKATLVAEAGRQMIPDSNTFTIGQLQNVVHEQYRQIEAATQGVSPLVIIDTDFHITNSYALFCYGQEVRIDRALYKRNKADLYFYLSKDAPYIQDGTRFDEAKRNLLDDCHRQVVRKYGLKCIELTGTWEERHNTAVAEIHKLLCKDQRR